MVVYAQPVSYDDTELFKKVYTMLKKDLAYPPPFFIAQRSITGNHLDVFVGNFGDSLLHKVQQDFLMAFAENNKFSVYKKKGIDYRTFEYIQTDIGNLAIIIPEIEPNPGMKSLWIKIPKKLLV